MTQKSDNPKIAPLRGRPEGQVSRTPGVLLPASKHFPTKYFDARTRRWRDKEYQEKETHARQLHQRNTQNHEVRRDDSCKFGRQSRQRFREKGQVGREPTRCFGNGPTQRRETGMGRSDEKSKFGKPKEPIARQGGQPKTTRRNGMEDRTTTGRSQPRNHNETSFRDRGASENGSRRYYDAGEKRGAAWENTRQYDFDPPHHNPFKTHHTTRHPQAEYGQRPRPQHGRRPPEIT